MQLYKINEALEQILNGDDYVNHETGEVFDRSSFDNLEIDKADKVEGVLCVYKNTKSLENALRIEAEALLNRASSLEKKGKGLLALLLNCAEGFKFESAKAKLSWRKSEGVEVTDRSLIPSNFQTVKEVYSIDKKGIKLAIQAGQTVLGAEIVIKQNPQIN